MKSYLGSLICRFKGHKWRRLRRKENAEHHITGTDPLRICDRCHVTRAVKTRKAE